MRTVLLVAIMLVGCLTSYRGALAQTTPLDPVTLDPAVTATLSQYFATAGYAYAGDCQTVSPVSGTVCTLVYVQADGSLLAQAYLFSDDGTYPDVPFTVLRIDLASPAIAAPVRLLIPRIGVDAAIVTLGVDAATNTLDAPKTRDDVGYYNFTPVPGYGGNTVLAGHVDWYTGQTGVFWDLKQLVPGDVIQLAMPDGSLFAYAVTDTQLYDGNTAPIDDILGVTPTEALTLITCEGVFNPAIAEYNNRRVVRAERLAE